MATTTKDFDFNEFKKLPSVKKTVTLPEGRHRGIVTSIGYYDGTIMINLETLDHRPIEQPAKFYMRSEKGHEMCMDFLSRASGYQKTMDKCIQKTIGKEVIISITKNVDKDKGVEYLNATVFALSSSVVEQPKPKQRKRKTTIVETVEEADVELTEADLTGLDF